MSVSKNIFITCRTSVSRHTLNKLMVRAFVRILVGHVGAIWAEEGGKIGVGHEIDVTIMCHSDKWSLFQLSTSLSPIILQV